MCYQRTKMKPSRRFWERRAVQLFSEWDAIEDPYGLPTLELQKALAKVNEAATISMVLDADPS